MLTIKVGTFPGELKDIAIQSGMTVGEILGLAGITVGNEQDITLDGTSVTPSTIVTSGALLLVTKRIKSGC